MWNVASLLDKQPNDQWNIPCSITVSQTNAEEWSSEMTSEPKRKEHEKPTMLSDIEKREMESYAYE